MAFARPAISRPPLVRRFLLYEPRFPASLWQVIAGGGLIAVFSGLGDLIASSIKREANVKDFGRALVPTGEFLDRFDSLVFAAPVFYVFALLLGGG